MVNSTGATARSWNRSTEKVARPVGEASRFCAARTGTTIAVEDSASATPDEGGRRRLGAERKGDRAEHGRAGDDLQRAEAEDEAPQRPQALPGQLDADHEQEEHDAELGEVRDLLAVADRDPGQPRRLADEAARGRAARAARRRRGSRAPG